MISRLIVSSTCLYRYRDKRAQQYIDAGADHDGQEHVDVAETVARAGVLRGDVVEFRTDAEIQAEVEPIDRQSHQ